jgi:hypothetical protein
MAPLHTSLVRLPCSVAEQLHPLVGASASALLRPPSPPVHAWTLRAVGAHRPRADHRARTTPACGETSRASRLTWTHAGAGRGARRDPSLWAGSHRERAHERELLHVGRLSASLCRLDACALHGRGGEGTCRFRSASFSRDSLAGTRPQPCASSKGGPADGQAHCSQSEQRRRAGEHRFVEQGRIAKATLGSVSIEAERTQC